MQVLGSAGVCLGIGAALSHLQCLVRRSHWGQLREVLILCPHHRMLPRIPNAVPYQLHAMHTAYASARLYASSTGLRRRSRSSWHATAAAAAAPSRATGKPRGLGGTCRRRRRGAPTCTPPWPASWSRHLPRSRKRRSQWFTSPLQQQQQQQVAQGAGEMSLLSRRQVSPVAARLGPRCPPYGNSRRIPAAFLHKLVQRTQVHGRPQLQQQRSRPAPPAMPYIACYLLSHPSLHSFWHVNTWRCR